MSYKGWLIVTVLIAILLFGGIYIIRTTAPLLQRQDRGEQESYSKYDIIEPYTPQAIEPVYNIETEGIPKLIDAHFIELDKIEYIKRFRSGMGYDSSDDFESCRCMDHNYLAFEEYQLDKEVKIYSPIDGTISRIAPWGLFINESWTWGGIDDHIFICIMISSSEYPAFTIKISLVDRSDNDIKLGMNVSAGEHLGYACRYPRIASTDVPYIGMAVSVNTPNGTKKLSYFDVITDNIFQAYKERGAISRDQFIISKEDRDTDPLNCEQNLTTDYLTIFEKSNIPDWVYLGKNPGDFQIISDIV